MSFQAESPGCVFGTPVVFVLTSLVGRLFVSITVVTDVCGTARSGIVGLLLLFLLDAREGCAAADDCAG